MDRLSDLSDELLLKILMFVPTKVAVSTSILSKRWEYLWMWLPKLGYSHRDCSDPECERLKGFLVRKLPLHKAPVIEIFHLRVECSCFKPENIHMWVSTAVSHCVRELKVVYDSEPPKLDILPSNLFTCKPLVFLKLAGDIILDVPRMVSLPCLKTLKLQRVTYFNDETLQRLLSHCPVLEDLSVDLGERDSTRKLTVVVPSLQSLSLYIPYEHRIDGYVIKTPNLKCFDLWDFSGHYHDCLIENMPNLIEAHLDLGVLDINSLIGSITSVKHLTISSKSHEPHQDMDHWNQPSTVPECLLSSLQTLNWSSYSGKPHERDIAVYILKHARHLKSANVKSSKSSAVRKHEMLKELALSSRASTTCQLMFE